jgi:hypothetical protein
MKIRASDELLTTSDFRFQNSSFLKISLSFETGFPPGSLADDARRALTDSRTVPARSPRLSVDGPPTQPDKQ